MYVYEYWPLCVTVHLYDGRSIEGGAHSASYVVGCGWLLAAVLISAFSTPHLGELQEGGTCWELPSSKRKYSSSTSSGGPVFQKGYSASRLEVIFFWLLSTAAFLKLWLIIFPRPKYNRDQRSVSFFMYSSTGHPPQKKSNKKGSLISTGKQ